MDAEKEQLRFEPWEPVFDAIRHAYKELGMEMEQVNATMRRYNPTHWNIAGKVYEWARSQNAGGGHCYRCGCALTFGTVIRCLDCKAPMCERCAPEHFGPNHAQRATAAHGAKEADRG